MSPPAPSAASSISRHAVALADRFDAAVVGALAVEVHRDHRSHPPAEPRTAGQLLVEQVRIEIPGLRRDVDEHRRRADIADRVGGRRERQRRGNHLVAATDTENCQRQVQGRRAARQRHRVRDTDRRGELALERVDVRPERRNPAGIEGVEQQRALGGADVGRRKVDAVHRCPELSDRRAHGERPAPALRPP